MKIHEHKLVQVAVHGFQIVAICASQVLFVLIMLGSAIYAVRIAK